MKLSKDYDEWLDYLVTQLGLKYSAFTTDVIYYERPRQAERHNALLKHGEKYPGLSEPEKQVHNLGFWYLWKDLPIKSFDEWKMKKQESTSGTMMKTENGLPGNTDQIH